jgi:hypothetical protein
MAATRNIYFASDQIVITNEQFEILCEKRS